MAWSDLADRVLSVTTERFDHGGLLYAPPGADPATAVAIVGVFSGDHVAVDLDSGVPVDTTAEVVGVKLADFVAAVGVGPTQGGRLVLDGVDYDVRSVQPDGQGGALLELEVV
jgi:hypothetical protein